MPTGYLRVIDLDTGAEVGALPHATQVKWLDDLYDVGAGSCRVPVGASELVDTPGLLSGRNAVQVLIDGVPRFAWRMQTVKVSEADPEYVQLSGPGVRDALQWGLVYPEYGLDRRMVPDRRLFGFQADVFDPAAAMWDSPAPHSFGTQADPTYPFFEGHPEGWPDPIAEWIAPETPATNVDGGLEHPARSWWFARRELNVATDMGESVMVMTGDERYLVWWDGELIQVGSSFYDFDQVDLGYVEAGTHVWAVAVYNSRMATGSVNNVSAFLGSIMTRDDEAEDGFGDVWARTFTPEVYGGAGNSPWYTLPHGSDRPGMTAGHVLRLLLEEAQARGALGQFTIGGFDDVTDSAGVLWPVTEYAFQVGNDHLLAVLNRMSDYGIDAQVGPDLTIDAWVAPKGVDRTNIVLPAAPSSGSWGRDLDTFDTVLLRTEAGWSERPTAPPAVRHEAFVAMGLSPTDDSARQVADRFADQYDTPRDTVELTYEPTGDGPDLPVPYVELQLGDTVQLVHKLDGDLTVGRVQTIGGALDDTSGEPSWTLELLL